MRKTGEEKNNEAKDIVREHHQRNTIGTFEI